MFSGQRPNYGSDNAAYMAIASKLGCSPDTLRSWHIQSERDIGERVGMRSEDKARSKQLERENPELGTANEILNKASAYLPRRSSTARSANNADCVESRF